MKEKAKGILLYFIFKFTLSIEKYFYIGSGWVQLWESIDDGGDI